MGVTRVLHGCYKGVTRVLLGCYTTETHCVDSCLGGVKSRGTVVWRDNWQRDSCQGDSCPSTISRYIRDLFQLYLRHTPILSQT